MTAYVFRFCSRKACDDERGELEEVSDLRNTDIKNAEHYWIRIAQRELDQSKIENVVPFIDDDGIKRANGRIRKSDIFNDDHP